MKIETAQTKFWSGDFGKEYTDRNTPEDIREWSDSYIKRYGVSRFDMFSIFLKELDKDAKILEVGCNTGLQLVALQELGFSNLYGIELQEYAVDKSKSITKNINIIQGNAFDIPFKDSFFDLVMTNGVLIHISPNDLPKAMAEIVRCSNKFILGFEYYSKEKKEITYRGEKAVLWKMDYAKEYMQNSKNLELLNEIAYPYLIEGEIGNVDSMFLLQKK